MTQQDVTVRKSAAAVPAMAGVSSPVSLPRRPATVAPFSLFRSFWMAGFEGADQINGAGLALSMYDITQHRAQAAADYARLA